jgi:hypothetical protein
MGKVPHDSGGAYFVCNLFLVVFLGILSVLDLSGYYPEQCASKLLLTGKPIVYPLLAIVLLAINRTFFHRPIY